MCCGDVVYVLVHWECSDESVDSAVCFRFSIFIVESHSLSHFQVYTLYFDLLLFCGGCFFLVCCRYLVLCFLVVCVVLLCCGLFFICSLQVSIDCVVFFFFNNT